MKSFSGSQKTNPNKANFKRVGYAALRSDITHKIALSKLPEVKIFRKFSRIPRHWQPLNTRTCLCFFGDGGWHGLPARENTAKMAVPPRVHARVFVSKSSFFAENGLLVAGKLSLFPL